MAATSSARSTRLAHGASSAVQNGLETDAMGEVATAQAGTDGAPILTVVPGKPAMFSHAGV